MEGTGFSPLDYILKSSVAAPEDPLLTEIRRVRRQMEAAYARFEMESDEDLVEAAIFEMNALHARCRYLLKLAKQQELENKNISAMFRVKAE